MNPTGWNPISLVVTTVKGIEETPQRCSKMLRSEMFMIKPSSFLLSYIWCWFRTLHLLLGTSLDNPGDKNQQREGDLTISLLHLESKINGSKLQRANGFAFPSRLMIINIIMMSVSLPASATLIFWRIFQMVSMIPHPWVFNIANLGAVILSRIFATVAVWNWSSVSRLGKGLNRFTVHLDMSCESAVVNHGVRMCWKSTK